MHTNLRNRSFGRTATADRSGAVTVEMAFVLPVLLLLVVGIIESCNLIYLKQSLTISAYEGARAGIAYGGTTADISLRANQVIADRGVASSSITVTPVNPLTAPYGTYLTVKVSAPVGSNSMFPGWFFAGLTLDGTVKMMKEY